MAKRKTDRAGTVPYFPEAKFFEEVSMPASAFSHCSVRRAVDVVGEPDESILAAENGRLLKSALKEAFFAHGDRYWVFARQSPPPSTAIKCADAGSYGRRNKQGDRD